MEVIRSTDPIDIEHEADIGVARRRLSALAASAGLDEARAGDAALIATELATNILRHARHGGVLLSCVYDGARRGVAISAWDRAQGMNLEACLRDGMSTAGTPGKGLGAVTRLASRWDAYTRPHGGTVVTAILYPRPHAARDTFDIGGICIPYPGQTVCGDAWDVHVQRDHATVIVCDGLGHGEGAAKASEAVIQTFRAFPHATPGEVLERASTAARSTRGAAATIVRIDRVAREATIAAVGNVSAWIVGHEQRQLVTQHGTLGQVIPRIHEERYAFPERALLLVCSDGLKSRIDLSAHPGLVTHQPLTIASAVWRDHARGRDDATAVVLREAS